MQQLSKVLYRKFLQDAAEARVNINAPAHHCVFTGLDFNAKTRTAGYWQLMNRIAQLRGEG